MKVNEIIQEAKFRKPIIMYHGTSTKFLRSILKNGVLPSSKEKVWADDPDANIDSFSRASIGGSYWTSNLLTAKSSSRNATRKFDGNSLIVVAQIAESSSFADEDSIMWNLKNAYQSAVRELFGGIYAEAVHIYAHGLYDDQKIRNKFFDAFKTSFHERSTENSPKVPMPDSLLENTCIALLDRYIAYTVAGRGRLSSWGGTKDLKDELFKHVDNKPEKILTTSESEQNLQHWVDKLTRYYRESAYKDSGKFSHTLRTEQPVTFRGANKIINILEILPDNSSIIVHYGPTELPQQFVEDWGKSVGRMPTVVKK